MSSILGVDLISYPSNCPPGKVTITADVAARIHQVLVAFGGAKPEMREPFKHTVMDTSLGGLGRRQFLVKDGYYGVCGFYMCGDDWYCVTTHEDLSPKTEEQLDVVNLKLALLRDQIKVELGIP
jgi:hypothetical protein